MMGFSKYSISNSKYVDRLDPVSLFPEVKTIFYHVKGKDVKLKRIQSIMRETALFCVKGEGENGGKRTLDIVFCRSSSPSLPSFSPFLQFQFWLPRRSLKNRERLSFQNSVSIVHQWEVG